jgi:ABC-2 type transport system ATP-binding protein
VRELQKEGVAILLTTHYLQEAEALCDRVGIIHQGRMVLQCSTKELMEKEGSLETAFLNLVRTKE